MNIIAMSWPSILLSPNKKQHPMQVYRWRKKARETAHYEMIAQRPYGEVPEGHLRLSILFSPPTGSGEFDLDNVIAMMKPKVDGMCDALGINDRRVREILAGFREPSTPDGYVLLRLDAAVPDASFGEWSAALPPGIA